MLTPPTILNKIKLLLKLSESSNLNEADNAKAMAEKLISKYNITKEELASLEDKVFYGENEKLFITFGIVNWRQQLSLAIANYFECQIVVEELMPGEGVHQFTYFVYGDDDQVKDTQFVYHSFCKKIDALSDTKCLGRGPIFIDSYCEGLAEAIKQNIQMYGIILPGRKFSTIKPEEVSQIKKDTLAPSKVKEEPTDKRVDVKSGSLIKDVMAYFKGISDGRELQLSDILELDVENKEVEQLDS